jgi:hypothetical protein
LLTHGDAQVDALLQQLLRVCKATGVMPVKAARPLTTERH